MKKVILISIFIPFLVSAPAFSQSVAGDIVITEIMADPNPAVSLPAAEFVEILNRTDNEINLEKWKFETSTFPAVEINPGEILILCRQADTVLFRDYGRVVGLKSFPAITDGGKILCLYNSNGLLIHGVEYSSEWYGNALKDNGGWSLEMVDTDYPFYGEGNWRASVNVSGGTPGKPNSVAARNPDRIFEGIKNVFPVDNKHLEVSFSEPVSDFALLNENSFIGEFHPESVIPSDPLNRTFVFSLGSELQNGIIYSLDINEPPMDFAGNPAEKRSYEFGLPAEAQAGDILFNELLFNPLPGDPDYIELYNYSVKILDAATLQAVSVNDDTGDTASLYAVSQVHRCILPKSYYAFTTERKLLLERYDHADPALVFEASGLPSMPDDRGHLILFNMQLVKIDEVYYSDNMHYSILAGTDGISLEKIRPDISSALASGWHSAAGSSGWGTPGARNSVYVDVPESAENILLSSTRISPDGDGFEDFLTIHFSLAGNANVVSVTAFDESGNFIRKIAENLLAGPESSIIWDGTAEDGSPARTGIYVILVTYYDEAGNRGRWKKVCTVVRK
jgi:hypothetical protein